MAPGMLLLTTVQQEPGVSVVVKLEPIDHQLSVGFQLVLALKELQHAGRNRAIDWGVDTAPMVGNKVGYYLLSSIIEQAYANMFSERGL